MLKRLSAALTMAAAVALAGCGLEDRLAGSESALALFEMAATVGVENIPEPVLEESYKAFAGYCETVPEAARARLRDRFNSHGPHKLRGDCEGDQASASGMLPDRSADHNEGAHVISLLEEEERGLERGPVCVGEGALADFPRVTLARLRTGHR